jgi:hypothetical protein
MKVNLGVELDDEQRMALASLIAGRSVKKLCSRDDVRAFIEGVVSGIRFDVTDEAALNSGQGLPAVREGLRTGARAASAYSPDEQREVDRLLAEGKTPEYARGWISAGRVIANGRKGA